MISAVLLGRVPDHLVTEPRVEVHVDIGHGDSAGVQEALEQQVVPNGIQVSDSEGVGHRTPCSAAPARADPNALVPGVPDEIPSNEEVRGEAHVADGGQFVRQTLHNPILELVTPSTSRPLEGQMLEVGVGVLEGLGNREVGQPGITKLDFHSAPLSDPQRVVAGVGQVPEQLAHLVGGLQVVLLAGKPEAVGVAHLGTGLDTEEGVVGSGVLPSRVVAVVGSQQRCPEFSGDPLQLGVGPVLLGDPLVLELDEEIVLSEDLLQPGRLGPGVVEVVPE